MAAFGHSGFAIYRLRGLSLKTIRVKDQSLAPAAKLKDLQALEPSNQFLTEEYARLSVALPHIQCPHLSPYFDIFAGKGTNQVMVTGKGKPVLTRPKDAERLQRYVQQFHKMQERFRGEKLA